MRLQKAFTGEFFGKEYIYIFSKEKQLRKAIAEAVATKAGAERAGGIASYYMQKPKGS